MSASPASSGWRRFWWRGGLWRALLVVVVYLALYLASGRLIASTVGAIDADELLSSGRNVFVGLTAAILVGIALLIVFTWSLGWLPGVFAHQPLPRRWWMAILPIAVLVFDALRFAAADYTRFDVATVVLILFSGLCIGMAEELLTRGLAVSLLRGAGYRELAVAVLSSLLFAGSHAVNLFSGQPLVVVALTVVYTFFFGVAMYLALRVTRRLAGPILLHALTDPSGLLLSGGVDSTTGSVSGVLAGLAGQANTVVILAGLVLVWFIRGRASLDVHGRVVVPVEPSIAGSTHQNS